MRERPVTLAAPASCGSSSSVAAMDSVNRQPRGADPRLLFFKDDNTLHRFACSIGSLNVSRESFAVGGDFSFCRVDNLAALGVVNLPLGGVDALAIDTFEG